MTESLRVLVTGLIDYAGLFPPASLSLTESVKKYQEYKSGDYSWMLSRFVLPLSRLEEFRHTGCSECMTSVLTRSVADIWAGIDTIEAPAQTPDEIHRLPNVTVYFEIPHGEQPGPFVRKLAETGGRAKMRTGGVEAAMIPSTQEVAGFIQACADARVPFKVTAGLHHPIRSDQRLTYEPDSACATMHGFLNVFVSAALAWNGCSKWRDSLEEDSITAFEFNDAGMTWRDRRLTTEQIRNARQQFAIGFGSCSFEEPVADLKAAGLL